MTPSPAQPAQPKLRNRRTRIALTLLLVGGVALAGRFVLRALWEGGCANTLQSRTRAPDGRHDAVVFERDCGATTDFSTQVSVIGAGETLPHEAGNVLVVDSDHGRAPAVVLARWRGPDELHLSFNPRVRIFKQVAAEDGVRIVFVPEP